MNTERDTPTEADAPPPRVRRLRPRARRPWPIVVAGFVSAAVLAGLTAWITDLTKDVLPESDAAACFLRAPFEAKGGDETFNIAVLDFSGPKGLEYAQALRDDISGRYHLNRLETCRTVRLNDDQRTYERADASAKRIARDLALDAVIYGRVYANGRADIYVNNREGDGASPWTTEPDGKANFLDFRLPLALGAGDSGAVIHTALRSAERLQLSNRIYAEKLWDLGYRLGSSQIRDTGSYVATFAAEEEHDKDLAQRARIAIETRLEMDPALETLPLSRDFLLQGYFRALGVEANCERTKAAVASMGDVHRAVLAATGQAIDFKQVAVEAKKAVAASCNRAPDATSTSSP